MGLVQRVDEITDQDDVYGDIGLLKCEPVKTESDSTPYSLSTPRRIAFPLLPKVEQELKCMQSSQVKSPLFI